MRNYFDVLRSQSSSTPWESQSMPRLRHVALLIDTSTDYSIHVIEGVARYAREHRPWNLLIQPRGERERSLMPKYWQPDGVIARVTHHGLAADLKRRVVPVVNVSLSVVPGYAAPQVSIDERQVGAWAAAHLWERGLRHFGYCGLWHQPNYDDHCGPSFVARLRQFDAGCLVHTPREKVAATHSLLTTADFQRWLMRARSAFVALRWNYSGPCPTPCTSLRATLTT